MSDSLIGRVVRIENPDLLLLFYPTFRKREKLSAWDIAQDILYTGTMMPNLRGSLTAGTGRWISTVGPVDVNLLTRQALVEFVLGAHGRKPTKALLSVLDMLEEDVFESYLKQAWVLGRWPEGFEGESAGFYTLYEKFLGTPLELVKAFLPLKESRSISEVESGLLTFFSRVLEAEDQTVNPAYQKVLEEVKRRSGGRIRESVRAYLQGEGFEAMRLLNLCWTVQNGGE